MKIIFLDIDGVLNCVHTKNKLNGIPFVDEDKILRLKKIIDATNAKIVLSSTWRFGMLFPDLPGRDVNDFIALQQALREHQIEIMDCTPYSLDGVRGEEINQWLINTSENIENFIILDDSDDIKPLRAHLILTDFSGGLQDIHVQKAIIALEGKNII